MPIGAALLLYDLQLCMHMVELQCAADELYCMGEVLVQLLLQI
jgi:hypothetical protein